MNSLLATSNGNAGKHADSHSCIYCKREFSNHRALGGHLRIHQEHIQSGRHIKSPCSSSNSNPLICLPENSAGISRQLLPFFNGESTLLDFPKSFWSHEAGLINTSDFCGNSIVNAKPESFRSLNLSSPNGSIEINYPNYLSSTSIGPSNVAVTTSLNTAAPPAAVGFPSDSSFSLHTNGVRQFNIDALQSWRDDTPSSSDALQNHQFHDLNKLPFHELQNRQFHDLNKLPYPAFAMNHLHPGIGSNQLPGFNESNIGSFPWRWGPCLCPGHSKSVQSNNRNALACERNKRPYLGGVPDDANMMNASKRPKINSFPPMPPKKPQKRELHLFKDMEHSFSGLGISSDAEEESRVDLDLSLHL